MNIAIIIVLLLAGSGSIAAENAVPGDFLYPVKVTVNEEVRGALSVSSKAKAEWNARLVERRLEEAEKLAAEARLDAELQAGLQSRLAAHFSSFDEQTEVLTAQGNASAAAEAHAALEAGLAAHADALANVGARVPSMEARVNSLLERVNLRLAATAQARAQAESRVAGSVSADTKAAAEGRLRAAENKLAEVKAFVGKASASARASVTIEAQAKLEASAAAIARGKAKLEQGTYGEAFVVFNESMRLSQGAKLLVIANGVVDVRIDAANRAGSEANSAPSPSTGVSGGAEGSGTVNTGNGTTTIEGQGNIRVDLTY